MRIMMISLLLLGSGTAFSQQAFTERITRKDKNNEKQRFYDANPREGKTGDYVSFDNISTFGLYGIGNINTEVFNSLNASGKLSGFIRPFRDSAAFTTINFSFNKNATNRDTLMASTFLFPDIGNNAFLGTVSHSIQILRKRSELKGVHLLTPFYEFSTKSIKREKDTISLKFTSINHVLGGRYSFLHSVGDDDVVFSLATFLALANIADQDNEDFRTLFESPKLPSAIWSLGFKVTFQYNNFQAYADMRHVFGSEEKIPVRSLRGFNANIGFVFNAEIFER